MDWVQVLLATITALLVLAGFTFLYLLFVDDNPPSEISNVHLHEDAGLDSTNVSVIYTSPSGVFYLGFDLCRHTDVPAKISRIWFDGLIHNEPAGATPDTTLPMGCRHIHREITVPNSLPPGTYYLSTTLEYHVNFLATRYVTYVAGPIVVED